MSKFKQYLDAVEEGALKLIKEVFTTTSDSAEEIFKAHLQSSEERLKRWSKLLASGELTEGEYKWLINNQITLGKMRLNTSKVVAKKQAIELREKLRTLFLESAIKVFL